ncbi:16S rRNA (cytosine(967)-C(5))-methyltransferase RsmB [Clostridium cellulovorans]|uniref:16S rRNA (cytosine(967)-C(5))-methyltransferase n=1 Tax=Clostridium cellulovorans (strain ATCC 35296 / DSM 3052 / OCM 3 / 743B) TaxID=573061 RepID=D9SLA3_CLOC7|nr:16S rRNA (cytosine(967)-C(5))-methyltransferase RsmB [Clostridium cellulovorans]ADL51619.1 sun protein [Clostridium cellulovorans 743B]
MSNPRETAVIILNKVFNERGYSNIIINKELNKSNLENIDKALVTEIVYGTIQYKYTIDKIIDHFVGRGTSSVDKKVVNILRSAIYQIRYLDKIPSFAVVNEAVELSKKLSTVTSSKFINGVLRNYIRKTNENFYNKNNLVDRLSFEYSFEPWMVKKFISQYGNNIAEKILKGLNERPSITVRVNSLKTTFDEAYEELEALGYSVEEGVIAPEAIRILKGKSIENNPLFIKGSITVQDESAMIVASALEPSKDDVIFDMCSAPGGKTTHIAELSEDKSKIKAFDIFDHKLKLIEENIKRLGITSIETEIKDASIHDVLLDDSADKVLIDVPCSGLGIMRKKPEIKYTKNEKDLKELVKIQRDIMRNAAKYVRKGGVLVYSTCTLNLEENQENIRWFLDRHEDFMVEKVDFGKGENLIYGKDNTLTILPNKYMDGFFIAKLKRIQ